MKHGSGKNEFSHLTAKERATMSFPSRFLMNNIKLSGRILDFGCGLGSDVESLKKKGFDVFGYDPHFFPVYPKEKFDTIICLYVLNVLFTEEQTTVLMQVSSLLKEGGKAYFAVRRDIQYEGFRTHKLHQKPTFQCNVKLPFQSILKNESCEIYEYSHSRQLSDGVKDCPFCNLSKNIKIISESVTTIAIYDKYPVSKGHALIIPKSHISNYFDLGTKAQFGCWIMVNFVKDYLQNLYAPDGFNIGINVGKSAGQSVFHGHIHVIPRYNGDEPNPRGGVRGVIGSKKSY